MRSELIVPAQLAGIRVNSENGAGVEVVAFALVAVVIGAGIAGGPVEQVRVGIVCAAQPRSGAPVLDGAADPGVGERLAGLGHCPEAPHAFAGGGIVGIDETARAFVTA